MPPKDGPWRPPKPPRPPAVHATAVHATERALHEPGLPDLRAGRGLGQRARVVPAGRLAGRGRPGELVVDHPALLGGQPLEGLGVDLLDALGRSRAEQVAVAVDGLLVLRPTVAALRSAVPPLGAAVLVLGAPYPGVGAL